MRETVSLTKEFDGTDSLVNETSDNIGEAFTLPMRNWNLIIDSYNAENKKKFPFSALQCRVILEYVKKGIPPRSIFKTLGVSVQRYTSLITKFSDLEMRMTELQSKPELTEEEYEEYNSILRSPFRLLMSDIDRAEGVSDLADWERFNDMATKMPDLAAMKMRAKFKEFFSDRESVQGGVNVQINLGGSWIEEL